MSIRLGQAAELVTDARDLGLLPFVALESVQSQTGKLTEDALPQLPAPTTGAATAQPGDVLFGKLRPYLAKTWAVDRCVYASTELLCLRPTAGVDGKWLAYAVASQPVVEWAVATADGAKMPRTSWERLRQFRLSVPPLQEQRAIADHLDGETTRVDALIGAKERMLKVLEERYWTAFTQRVADQPSQRTPLRRVLTSLIDGPFGSAFSSSDYSDEGAAVIRLGNIGFGEYRSSDQARIPTALYDRFRAFTVDSGDLLIAGLGDDRNHAGRACVAPVLGPAIVKGKCFRGRTDPSRVSAEFLALLLSSPIGSAAMSMAGRGSTRSMINLEIVKSTEVWLPNRSRQDEIVTATLADRSRLRAAQVTIRRQLQVLFERRQATITTAVAGDLPVSVAV